MPRDETAQSGRLVDRAGVPAIAGVSRRVDRPSCEINVVHTPPDLPIVGTVRMAPFPRVRCCGALGELHANPGPNTPGDNCLRAAAASAIFEGA